MRSGFRAFHIFSLLTLIIFSLTLSACGRGPFAPEARQQAAELTQYTKLLQSALVTDDTFEWNTVSSALIVRALHYSPRISREAERRYLGDPTFSGETDGWGRLPRRVPGPATVILMGIFAPDLGEKDLTKLGRFRPRLVTPDGRILEPVEIKRYGSNAVFIRDHFPVFNPWEEVYLVKFGSPGRSYGGLDFRLEWPGGVQTLTLPVD